MMADVFPPLEETLQFATIVNFTNDGFFIHKKSIQRTCRKNIFFEGKINRGYLKKL